MLPVQRVASMLLIGSWGKRQVSMYQIASTAPSCVPLWKAKQMPKKKFAGSLKRASKPGIGGQSPVHAAAKNGRLEILKAIIDAGADCLSRDSDGRSALMHGVMNYNPGVVGYLLDRNAFDESEVDAEGQTPLIVATVLGSNSMVSMLLKPEYTSLKTINVQDYEQKTALAHATLLDNLEIVERLLESSANPSIVDCRNRSPLYWAARAARMGTLNKIIEALEKCNDHTTEPWNVAVHGAVASNKQQALLKLLEKEDIDVEYAGPDGWIPLYTAITYDFNRMKDILQDTGVSSLNSRGLERLSRWHLDDRFPGLELGSDGTTLSNIGGTKFVSLVGEGTRYGAARTDYPMLPCFNNRVFYFEIQIIKAAEDGSIGIGFCEDKAPLNRMLGWDAGSWGFHSDDGCIYEDGKRSWEGIPYSKPYSAGEIIGCGVNFEKNKAFYTRGRKVIGQAFEGIYGKLYPAVSMNIAEEGWEIKAVFPDSEGKSADFVFQGDYDSTETLIEKENSKSDDDSGAESLASD